MRKRVPLPMMHSYIVNEYTDLSGFLCNIKVIM
jgi:hypothetical protein